MQLYRDYRLDPPPAPREIGECAGCGDQILPGESYATNERGEHCHMNFDCLAYWAAKVFGVQREDIE